MGANREDGIDLTNSVYFALYSGSLLLYHGYRDEKMAFSVMAFIMTGYAIILYLNQDDPQPRERLFICW